MNNRSLNISIEKLMNIIKDNEESITFETFSFDNFSIPTSA